MIEFQEARDLASRFVDTITKGQEPLSQLRSVLTARGYLIEDAPESQSLNSENLFMNDNSCKDDVVSLHDLLVKQRIGQILNEEYRDFLKSQYVELQTKRWEIFITGTITREALIDIFVTHEHRETGGPYYIAGKKIFKTFIYSEEGPNISVDILDPYIARLVKTFNAIGIETTFSCDGNYGDRDIPEKTTAYVQLQSIYDSMWFAILLNRYITPNNILTSEWRISEDPERVNTIKITSSEKNPLNLYLEIQKVSEIFYTIRIILRDDKKAFCKKLTYDNWISRVESELELQSNSAEPNHDESISSEFVTLVHQKKNQETEEEEEEDIENEEFIPPIDCKSNSQLLFDREFIFKLHENSAVLK